MRVPSSGPEATQPDGPDKPDSRGRGAGVWTSTTYFAEGLPWSLLHQVAAEFFTALGLPPRLVGYTSALHLTGTLKFLWSPIVDLFGSLRQWMIATQVAMGVAVGYLAVHAKTLSVVMKTGSLDTSWIWVTLVIIGILSATHDIACDGYYMDALDRDDQARYSGLRIAAFRLAMFTGSSGLVYVGGRFGWLHGFGAGAAILLALAGFHRMILPRGENERRLPSPEEHSSSERGGALSPERLRHVVASYVSFLGQSSAVIVLLFIMTYKLGDALMFSMSKVLLRDLGVNTETRALLNGIGVASMILGATLAGAWIARRGLARTLLPITLLMALSEPLYVLLAGASLKLSFLAGVVDMPVELALDYAPSFFSIAAILVIEQFAGGMATAAQMIFIMRRCHPDHKAAHYAFATALYLLAQTVTGTFSGVLYELQGPVIYFAVASLACVPCLLLVNHLPHERHDA